MRERIGRIAFTALLVGSVAALLVETLPLSPPARLVPLTVAVATLLTLTLQLIDDLRRSRAAFETTTPYGVSWLREQVRRAFSPTVPDGTGVPAPSREFAIFGWIAAIPLLTWLVGVAAAAPLYTVIYLRKRARERWPPALAVTTIVAGFPWALAHFGIAGRLFEGALWRWLGI